ncbi:hypothetical protein [Chitinimonas koreensis]|nr:hypothetical protein [Chitinimonas koreensis]
MAELKLNQLQKTYDDGTAVIHGIDLAVRDGEFMVFVGPRAAASRPPCA